MKKELINFITAIGLVLLGSAVVLGLLTALLFIFPNLSFFGAKSVNERDTQIVYKDEALTTAFANGNFIIESTGTKIEVKMSNEGYEGEGTIVVNETATGIAFNSLNRTLVQWTQTLYNEELYYKIKVLEPSGIVFSDKPTTVYINLPHRGKDDTFVHDFVLQNNYSDVNFSFADNTVGQTDTLRIGNLVVESAANVNIPANENISLNNIEIKSSKTKFVCQSVVTGDVTVTGSNGVQTFNADIMGDVKITGANNQFHGDTADSVTFSHQNGSLTMNEINELDVATVNAKITVGKVNSGVTMTTMHGSLSVDEIVSGGVDFTAGKEDNATATASISIGSVVGDVTVKNYGIGSVNLAGVNGNVDVLSCEVGGGNIDVGFQDDASECSVKVLGYDGNINVHGINGKADITVRNWENGAGAANIKAHFNKVVGTDNVIKAGGYVSGHHDWGNVDLLLNNSCNNFNLYVYGASSANSAAKYGFAEDNMHIINDVDDTTPNNITVGSGEYSAAAVKVYSKQAVYLA